MLHNCILYLPQGITIVKSVFSQRLPEERRNCVATMRDDIF